MFALKRFSLNRIMSFYAVSIGRKAGIYSTWSECEAQVKNFSNAKYKKFKTNQEALEFIQQKNTISLDSLHQAKVKAPRQSNKRKLSTDDTSTKRRSKSTSPLRAEETNEKVDFNFNGDKVTVYTDGACSSNGQKGASAGIGVYWGQNHPLNVSRKLKGRQTNNRAEITAALVAINQAIVHNASELTLYTDSQFTINCITQWITKWKSNGWKLSSGEDVKNVSDLKLLDQACSLIKVHWKYVPGHKGILENEMADKLARDALQK